MKVYVDFEELDVEDKPTYICNKYNLQVKSINSGSIYENVKLVSLSDHDKQVRKEVVEEIVEAIQNKKGVVFGRYNYQTGKHDEIEIFELGDLIEILDRMQGDAING